MSAGAGPQQLSTKMDSDSDYQPGLDDDSSDSDNRITVDELFDQIGSPFKRRRRSFHDSKASPLPNSGNLPFDLKETSPAIVVSIPTQTEDESYGHPTAVPSEGTCHYIEQPPAALEIQESSTMGAPDATFSIDPVDGPHKKEGNGHGSALPSSQQDDDDFTETIFDEECNVISPQLLSYSLVEVFSPILMSTHDDLGSQHQPETNEEGSLEKRQGFENEAQGSNQCTLEPSPTPEPVILDCNSQPICDNVTEKEKEKKEKKRRSAKESRMRGEKYIGFRRRDKQKTNIIIHDVPRNERRMGSPCRSQRCRTFSTRSCPDVTPELRDKIFHKFWKKWHWQTKQEYVCSAVDVKKTGRPTKKLGESSKRQLSYFYHLKIKDKRLPVCKKMFMQTLGVKENEVRYWLDKHINERVNTHGDDEDNDNNELDLASGPGPSNESGHEIGQSRRARKHKNEFLETFLNNLPKLPSHYCRKQSTQKYLQTDIRSMARLYDLYEEACKNSGEASLKMTHFATVCKEMKISIFMPRKDRCDTCCSYEAKNLSEVDYQNHVAKKDAARQEKEKDKEAALRGDCHTICCDLMAVQPLPSIRASAAYYKLKLCIHNYTVFNLATKDSKNYWFEETEGTLCASTFASCLTDYIEELLNLKAVPVIIYSDGCTAQNRNSVLSNALLHLSKFRGVPITQKYLERGHTQMEADSVHATIERAFKDVDVHVPSNFTMVTQIARRSPFPYRAKLLDHKFFTDYSDTKTMAYPSIRPGRKTGEPTVMDLRVLHYDPCGTIRFKLNFNEELQDMPRPKKINNPTNFPKLHQGRLAIPYDKWLDLQSLKSMLPQDTHSYFDAIPHDGASKRKRKNEAKTSMENKKKKIQP